jgi:ElaB/YqjD/DUF883 family membrane-anchored ribosome-binding protein
MSQSNGRDFNDLRGGVEGVGPGADRMKDEFPGREQGDVQTSQEPMMEVKSRIRPVLDKAKRAATQASSTSSECITANPFTSVGVAFGLGLVVGLLTLKPRARDSTEC